MLSTLSINWGNRRASWCIKGGKETHSIHLNMIRNNSCKWIGVRDRTESPKYPNFSALSISSHYNREGLQELGFPIHRICCFISLPPHPYLSTLLLFFGYLSIIDKIRGSLNKFYNINKLGLLFFEPVITR